MVCGDPTGVVRIGCYTIDARLGTRGICLLLKIFETRIMSEVIIRTFEDKDQPKIHALYKAGENTYMDIPVAGPCYRWFVNDKLKEGGDVAEIRKHFFGDGKIGNFWVAELDGNIVGFVGATKTTRFEDDHIELVRMFVSPEIRKKAVAGKLLGVFEAWAAEAGYKFIYLTTLAAAPGANALYRKSGFSLVDTEAFDVTSLIGAEEPTTVGINHYVKSIA